MPISNALLDKLTQIETSIEEYRTQAKAAGRRDKKLQQQWKKLQALHKLIKIAKATQSLQEEDDWKTLLASTDLPQESKDLLRTTLATVKEETAKNFVVLVTNFYQQRYSNHQKHLGKLELGIEITKEQYLDFLQQAIAYTIDKKGVNANSQDFSTHLILLLKGRLKANPKKEGEMQLTLGNPSTKGTQVEINWESKPKSIDWPKKWLNKLPIFKNSMFSIDEANIALTLTGVATFDQGKYGEIDTSQLGKTFVLSGEAFSRSIGLSLSDQSLSSNFAAGELKLTLTIAGVPFEVGVKVADLVLSLEKEEGEMEANIDTSFTPIEISAKGSLDGNALRQLLPDEEILRHFLDIKLEVGFNISTSLGVDLSVKGASKLDEVAKKLLQQQEALVDDKYLDYLKKQEAFGELVDQQDYMRRLQEERRELAKRIAKEVDPKKKKQLLAKSGRRYISLLKENKRLHERLKQQGVGTLQGLHEQLGQQGQQLEKAVRKITRQYDEAVQKITSKTSKLALSIFKKQAGKRLVSVLAKAVPGLNIISFALDAYDIYVLVKEVHDSYKEAAADLQLQLDADIEEALHAEVDITDLSSRVTDFYGYLGAGGKLIALTQTEADELTTFFEFQFESDADFEQFLWAYGDYYDVHKRKISDNSELVDNVYLYTGNYNLEMKAVEAQLANPNHMEGKKTNDSKFFDKAIYTIISGNPLLVGNIIEVNATCMDTRKDGKTMQVSFPQGKWLKLEVVQDLGDGQIKLKPLDHYDLKVPNFKSYKMHKSTVFIFDKKSEEIRTRNDEK